MNFILGSPVTANESDPVVTNAVATFGHDIAVTVNTDNFLHVVVEVSDDNLNFTQFPLTWRWDSDDNAYRPAKILTTSDPLAFNAEVGGFGYVRLKAWVFDTESANVSIGYSWRN